MYMAKSLKDKKKKLYHISYNFFFEKYVLACILSFNKQFIKAMKTRPIFQKIQKNYFVLLISRIINLYIRFILDIE
jgi:hypothetical protein